MDLQKKKAIQEIVDETFRSFMDKYEKRFTMQVSDPDGVINAKKNNCFVSMLGKEFMFYSAFVRSFDSSFGTVLEHMGRDIAALSYEVRGTIRSYLLPQQTQHIDYLMTEYEQHVKPEVMDYSSFSWVVPRDVTSYAKSHETDNYFYNPRTNEHFVIEVKLGGDLDNKKARAEKIALLHEYFLLKNSLMEEPEQKIKIFLGTAYNKFGEGNEWKHGRVQQFFADGELLIGKDYWNFVCDDDDGFACVFEQYQDSAKYIQDSLARIKNMYF